jgi:hypothetical protein
VTPDQVAAELLARVGHVHVATTPEGWHCFTFTMHGRGTDDIEVLCGDGATIAEALQTVLSQVVPDGAAPGPASEQRKSDTDGA